MSSGSVVAGVAECWWSAGKIFDEKPKGGSRGTKQPSINRGPENGGLRGRVEKGWDRRVRFCSHS